MRTLCVLLALGMGLSQVEAASGFKDKKSSGEDKASKKASSSLSTQQRQNLTQLKTDLQAIHGKSQVTTQQKQAVIQDVQKILMGGAHPPSQQSVQALASDLTNAAADGKISTTEAVRLTQDVAEVLNSANISQQDAQQLAKDVQTLLKATNVSQQDVQRIVADVQAIVKTAQQNAQKVKGKGKG